MTVIEKFDSDVEEKVQKMKMKFSKEMKPSMAEDNHLFYRFLKARDFNLDQAEAMLKKHLEWRKEWKVDTLMSERVLSEEIASYIPITFFGFDKEHCPLKYFAYGRMDTKGVRAAAKFHDRVKFTIQMLEEENAIIEKQSKKVGKNLQGTVYIVDMKDFSFAVATDKKVIEEMIYFAKMIQDHNPERLKHVYIINASTYFSISFSILKNFLAAAILKKISVYAEPEAWKPVLLKAVDADVLPAFLGGKKMDPDGDEMCRSMIKHGGTVPKKLYMTKDTKSFVKSKNVKKLVIPRASFSEIELDVEEGGSLIEWEFETKSSDIGFGLFLKEAGEEEKIVELVPLMRLETDMCSETGMYKCEKAGRYIMLFDNSYSWIKSKELYYKAIVVTPTQHESEMKS